MALTTTAARRWLLAPLAVLLAIVASGCDNGRRLQTPQQQSSALVVSETWLHSVEGTGTDAQDRIAGLQRALEALRKETGTGWTGRQDDVTGYLAQLRGGSWPGTPADFMDAYGDALFGVGPGALRFEEPDTTTVPGMSSVRAKQAIGEVPVLDGTLMFTSRGTADDEKLTEVRGRVFPELAVDTEPRIDAKSAARIAEEASTGKHEGPPTLVVLPDGAGVLTWEVTIVSADGTGFEAGSYYVDAITGDIVSVRPISVELGVPNPWTARTKAYLKGIDKGGSAKASRAQASGPAEPEPNSVEVTGVDPTGKELTAHGLQTGAGVELIDSTTSSWDSTSRRGGVATYDASEVTDERQLPGQLVTSPDTRIRDADSIAAHAYSKDVLDYYASLGRNSWDNRGGSAVSSVHFGPPEYCNAFFSSSLLPPQMVYANPCTEKGEVVTASFVGIDISGHEITHGVTNSTADLIYAGQSGALNESFSDYFGNVIGNRVNGDDSAGLGEELCYGITAENRWCVTNPDGSKSLRYMLNGNDFDEYLRILNPGLRLRALELIRQDNGGVHLNSAIWNNALWSIRTQLAAIDGESGNTSELAQAFDKVVYGALTTRLGPTSGFIDARDAVEQVIVDSSLDPVVLRVARETFDANKICVGCSTIGQLAGDTVTATPHTQLHPSVSGDLVAWLDMSAGDFVGTPASLRLGGSSPTIGAGDTWAVALAGEALLVNNGRDEVVRYDGSGASLLASGRGDLVVRGLAGSDAGGAWAPTGERLSFVDINGTVTTTDVPGLAGDQVISVGTGGGTVAAGTEGGKVLWWRPGGPVTELGRMSGKVATVAPHGDNVFAVACTQEEPGKSVPDCYAELFTADGKVFAVSQGATVLGAATSEDYVVWPEDIGIATSGVIRDSKYPDTDLWLLSLKTGKIYSVLQEGGQQGFPSLSGRRLVWQDSVFGGDDIFTAELPPGL